eukprot:852992_1
MARNDAARYEFTFHFLQFCYLNNVLPTQKQIINKYYNNGVSSLDNSIHDIEHMVESVANRNIENHTDDIVYSYNVSEFVPGDYYYQPENGEGVPMMVFAGTNGSNNSNTNNNVNINNNSSQNNRHNNNQNSNEGDSGGGGGGNSNGGYNRNDEDKNNDKDKKK